MTSKLQKRPEAFVMPMVLIIMSTLMLVVLLISQSVIINQAQITRHGYNLIARAAAKAATDYAKEELDSNLSYCGTTENRNDPTTDSASTVLYNSTVYKVTYQVEVYDGVCTGTGRNIRAVGRVYIPELSITAAYVQDIRVRLVRSGLYTESPGDFSPIAWYKSNIVASLQKDVANNFSQSFNATSSHEERVDGTVSNSVCNSNNNDLEMPYGSENGTTQNQNLGLVFANLSIPQGATITRAYIQFRSRGTSGTNFTNAMLSLPLTMRLRGFDTSDKAAFSCPGSSQFNSATGLTSQQVDWAMPAWPSQNQSGAAQQSPDLTSIVQAIVNRGDWSSNNDMGFRLGFISGAGGRNAQRGNGCSGCSGNHLRLYVDWTTGTTPVTATNGDTIDRWLDQSGNGNNLVKLSGTPSVNTGEINSQQVVDFYANNGTPEILGNLNLSYPPLSTNNMTVVAVMRPTTSGASGGSSRFITLLNASNINDSGSTTANAVRAFTRDGTSSSLTSWVNNFSNVTPISNALSNNFASGQFGVYAFRFGATTKERLAKNGAPTSPFEFDGGAPSYNVNQLLLGGTTSALGTYTLAGDMQLAELVIYDKDLSCSQLRLIENHYALSSQWAITSSSYNCPLQ